MIEEPKNKLSNNNSALNLLGAIKRYPFNGRSKNLIDKFYIIGYDYLTLNKILIKNNLNFIQNASKNTDEEQSEKIKNKLFPQEYIIKEPPSLINEISNDYTKEVLDIDIIIEMIFPNKPKFYYVEEDLDRIDENSHNNSTKKMIDLNEIRRARTNVKEENFVFNSGKNKIDNDLYFNTVSNNKYKDNTKKNSIKEEYIPRPYNVVFSSNPQSGTNSKKSINGFAHIFYKKFNEKKITDNFSYSFFVPIVFCIISEFPYYNSYYKLIRQIMLLFKEKIIEVPIEFTLQNIVNFTLSPINDEVILNISQISLIKLWNSGSANIDSIKEEPEEKENDKNKEVHPFSIYETVREESFDEIKLKKKASANQTPNINRNSKKQFRKSNFNKLKTENLDRPKSPSNLHKTLKTSGFSKNRNNFRNTIQETKLKSQIDLLSKYASNSNISSNPFPTKFIKNEEESTIKIEPIKFEFLPGYPLMQYNLAKVLLNNLSPYDVIVIFIYTFLEKDVIFFSNNLELLSLTLHSYQNLNFPLNDEKYYFINACVSYDNYIKGNSTFVGSAFTTMVGINDQYQPKYINSASHKLKDHLAIDLDNGNVYQAKENISKEEATRNKTLFDFIKKTCKNKELKEDKNILSRQIRLLYDELNKCKEKIIYDSFNIIDYDNGINDINLEIQESFYKFINNICIYLYQNLFVTISTTTNKAEKVKTTLEFDDKYSFNEEDYSKEEKLFLDELRETMKFESFIYGFIQSYNPIDLYKIPLTFTEEFVSILSRKSSIQLRQDIKYLSLFDNLYHKKEHGRIDIDFHPFISKYFVQYKERFDRDVQDYYLEQKEDKNKFNLFSFIDEKKAFNFNYLWYELDNDLILKYFDLLKNLDHEEYDNLFHFPLLNLEQNTIKSVTVTDIENEVEKYAIEANFLSKNDICCANILLLFTLTLKNFRSSVDIQSFLGTLFHDFVIFRKYYSIVMNTVYKLMEECINKNDYVHANNFLLCYYPCINSINESRLVPNENLMNTIKKFNLIDIDNIIENSQKDKEKYNTPKSENTQSLIKNKLNWSNLYVCYNFTKKGTINENKIIYEINNNNEKYQKRFNNSCKPKIRFRMGKKIIESEIYSQLQLLEMLMKEYNVFNKDLDINNINANILLYASINIFIFIRNNSKLNDKTEIIEILNTIFYIYLEKYNEKEIKEKKAKENEIKENKKENKNEKEEEKENEKENEETDEKDEIENENENVLII